MTHWHQAYDFCYLQFYYYCRCTQISTWLPPAEGFAPLTYSDMCLRFSTTCAAMDSCHMHNRVRFSSSCGKYWVQRRRILSLYDFGVNLDPEAPEIIANHQASRCLHSLHRQSSHRLSPASDGSGMADSQSRSKSSTEFVVLDLFCGAGGNTIAFARCAGARVLACDINETRLDMADKVSLIYGVQHSINFVCNDANAFLNCLRLFSREGAGCYDDVENVEKVDMIFLSPPWGGPGYSIVDSFDIRNIHASGIDVIALIKLSFCLTTNIALYLPKNTDLLPFYCSRALFVNQAPCSFEVEKNYLNGKLKAITLYFGELNMLTS
ncbi:uncharacterized protein MICPUCDRAFT_55679 [Micromonas pusilla CCMP1545]|uniref:Trimethylguanosine synthase n=1 Tax=Micromonas pusilla (strain CCMP1545) TaxID=564608 RepID=C1MLD9_MICPC|nr:uncharacterized protein MICPUCDRAFT_55679 [Micromonas pusilla CCMP1545]EEH59924.1 hypothetical protein MICPUCDRAFT_55679 [Micromonas pusilla CCMP1545]|eukprot:XP_003056548.1 hypothetical protein MICPUCDRAFT_55679 [Micromonas pusilla CCMP1545]